MLDNNYNKLTGWENNIKPLLYELYRLQLLIGFLYSLEATVQNVISSSNLFHLQ